MGCFIKKIFSGNIDENVHRQFVRFSRGSFSGRAALNLKKNEKIILGGSFEYANDFVSFAAENSEAKFSGKVLSRSEIPEFGKSKGKNGVYDYEIADVSSEKIKEISGAAYSMLLDAVAPGLELKIKKKLPKPGKSGDLKIDDKFCVIEADLRFWGSLKEAFMLPECKKAKISHTIIVSDVIIDRNEKDFAKMRENARKKGKIVRKMNIDGNESFIEKEFVA